MSAHLTPDALPKPVPASEGRQALPLPSKRSRERTGAWVRTGSSVKGSGDDAGKGGGAPEARPALPAVPVSSRLDTGTIYDQPPGDEAPKVGYRAVLRDYGDGLVEASITIKTTDKKRRPATPAQEQTQAQIEENKNRAIRRSRTIIRQTIMAARLDHLVTLTYRENQICPTLAWKHFGIYTRLLRKHRRGEQFAFIAVLERQKRGAMHVHMAVHGFQDVKMLRALWHQAIGTKAGNIDVQYFRGRLPTLARYLSKYITKDVDAEHEQGDHRYKRSRNIVVPKLVAVLPFHIALNKKLIELFREHGAVIKFHINSLERDGPKWLWACSW